MAADRDIVLNIGLNTDDVLGKSKEMSKEIQSIFKRVDTSKLTASSKNLLVSLNKLEQQAQGLRAQLEELGSSVINTEEYDALLKKLEKIEPQYQKIIARQAELNKKEAELKASGAYVPTKEFSSLQKEIGKTADKLDTLTKKEEATRDIYVPTKEFSALQKEIEKTSEALTKAFQKESELRYELVPTKEYAEITAQIDKETAALTKLQERKEKFEATGGKTNSRSYKAMLYDIKQLKDSIAEATKNKKELEDAGNTHEQSEEYNKAAQALNVLTAEYKNLLAEEQRMKESGQAEQHTQAYTKLTEQITETATKLNELQEKEKELIESDKATELSSEYKKVENELEAVNQKFIEINDSRNELLQQKIDLQSTGKDTISGNELAKYKELSNTLNDVNNKMVTYLGKADAAKDIDFSRTSWSLKSLAKSTGQVAVAFGKISLSGVLKGLKELAKLAGKAVVSLTKLAGSSIRNGIAKLGHSLTGLNKSGGNADKFFKHAFTNIIKYGFGVRSLYFLVRKLRTALVEGFGDLAKVSEPFNVAVSNMLTALRLLRNSFASAFSPIIEVVSPILTHFINQMAEAVTKLGMLIAKLTGKDSYMRAIPVYQDYAASLDKSSKNTDKASKKTDKLNKEAEKLKKTLAGFDDVEILKGPDDDNNLDNLTDALDEIEEAEQQFEQVPLGETFTNLSDLLKRAWANADFTEVGKILGEKLLKALQSIPWNKIKAVAQKLGKSIATLLNGFLEVDNLFTNIGETVAQAINSLFEFLYAFITNFHWDSLGKAIQDAILGFTDTLDWELIKQTFMELGKGFGDTIENAFNNPEIWSSIFNSFAEAFNALILGIHAFISSVSWGEIGANIAQGLNDGINTFDWQEFAQTLIDLVNNAFDFWYNFVTTFDFEKFGNYIGQTFADVINNIDWTTGSASVAETLNGLLEALNGFFDAMNEGEDGGFKQLGHKIVEVIATFLDTFSWGEFGDFLGNCLDALCNFLIGIAEDPAWDNLAEKICEKIGEFLEGHDWKTTAYNVLTALWKAFWWWITNAEMSRLFANIGVEIVNGLLEGAKEKIKSIGAWVDEHIFNPIANAIEHAFGISSPAKEMIPIGEYIIAGVLEGLSNGISNIYSVVESAVHAISDTFSGLLDWGSIGSNIIDGIIGGLDWGGGNLFNVASSLAIGAYNAMVSALDIGSPSKLFRNGIGKMIPAGMALGIIDNEGLVEDAMDSLVDTTTSVGKKALKVPAVVKGAVVPYQAKVSSQTESALENIVEALDSNYSDKLTRDDLQDIIVDVINAINGIGFYIGDEDLARHANNGNSKLGRRYNTTSFGGAY